MARQFFASLAVLIALSMSGGGSATQGCNPASAPCLPAVGTIAFTSSMDHPLAAAVLDSAEIYLINEDNTNLRRLTDNDKGDGFPALSPDGLGKLVFDSNRLRAGDEPINTSFLFFMKTDEPDTQIPLVRGGSPTWDPSSRFIAFHASATGAGLPVATTPGAATSDSDIFIVNVDDLLAGVGWPRNVTQNHVIVPDGSASPVELVDDDPDWGVDPYGGVDGRLAFTAHRQDDTGGANRANFTTGEIYIMPIGTTQLEEADLPTPMRLTTNNFEERAPDWSPDGTRLVYMCRRDPLVYGNDFELCVMNDVGTSAQAEIVLTNNATGDLSPKWSPDGTQIIFHGLDAQGFNQLWTIPANATGYQQRQQLTNYFGHNLFADWSILKIGHPEKQSVAPAELVAWYGNAGSPVVRGLKLARPRSAGRTMTRWSSGFLALSRR